MTKEIEQILNKLSVEDKKKVIQYINSIKQEAKRGFYAVNNQRNNFNIWK